MFNLISKIHNARASCNHDGTRSDDINQAPAHLIAIKSELIKSVTRVAML